MDQFYEVTGTITNGKVVVDDPHGMVRALKNWADGDVVVKVERLKHQRSGAQNRFWHGIVIPAFMDATGEFKQDRNAFARMKDALALALIPKTIKDLDGTERVIPGHTSDLSVAEFNQLIERAQELGSRYGVYVPDPGEYLQGKAS
jgi:hypothetical protein